MERELLLLGILRRQQMHGYQLIEFIDQNLGTCTDLKKPTAYFLLEKMTQKGWITFEQNQSGNRPLRRVYRLTPAGEQAYQELLRAVLRTYTPAPFPADIGLAFLDQLDPAEARELLEAQMKNMQEYQEVLHTAPAHPGTAHWMIEHQITHLKNEIAWLQKIIHRLEYTSANSAED